MLQFCNFSMRKPGEICTVAEIMTLSIEPLTAENSGLLLDSPGVFEEMIDPGRLADYIAAPGHLMLIAIADGVVVAQIGAVIHRHPFEKTELFVDKPGIAPAFKRQDVGKQLLEQMLCLGRMHGCDEAWIGSDSSVAL